MWADLLIDTAIVQSTGGLDSDFVFLHTLSVTAASIALPSRATCAIAAGASILYSLLVYLDAHGIIRPLPLPSAL